MCNYQKPQLPCDAQEFTIIDRRIMFQLFSTKKIIPSSPIKTQTALNLFVIKYIILYSHNDNHKVARRQFFQQMMKYRK